MQKKSDKVRELVASGQFDKALSLAKTFRMWASKEDGKAVQLAHEVKTNPDFYKQIGKDIQSEYKKGVDVLVRIYGAQNEK